MKNKIFLVFLSVFTLTNKVFGNKIDFGDFNGNMVSYINLDYINLPLSILLGILLYLLQNGKIKNKFFKILVSLFGIILFWFILSIGDLLFSNLIGF